MEEGWVQGRGPRDAKLTTGVTAALDRKNQMEVELKQSHCEGAWLA